MPADYYVTKADMETVANAIRTKGKTTVPLSFPTGMADAVAAIPEGREPVITPIEVQSTTQATVHSDDPLTPTTIPIPADSDGVGPITLMPARLQWGQGLRPRTYDQHLEPQEGYVGFSSFTLEGDPDLLPENIKKGVFIFGIEGTVESKEPVVQPLNVTPSAEVQTFTPPVGVDGYAPVTVQAATAGGLSVPYDFSNMYCEVTMGTKSSSQVEWRNAAIRGIIITGDTTGWSWSGHVVCTNMTCKGYRGDDSDPGPSSSGEITGVGNVTYGSASGGSVSLDVGYGYVDEASGTMTAKVTATHTGPEGTITLTKEYTSTFREVFR